MLAVIAFHALATVTPNGFAGVDVFFGLSGFLITSLLLREHEQHGRIHLGHFYLRRLLRLYPALVLAVAGVLLLGVVAGRLGDAVPAGLAALLYVAHLWIAAGHDAWLLDHTWTLSLEEHYYLAWPGLLVLLLATPARRVVGAVAAAALLVVVGTPLLLPDAVVGMYLRAAPMLWGTLAALAWWRWGRGLRLPGLLPDVVLVALVVVVFWPSPLPHGVLTGLTSVPGWLAVLLVVALVSSTGGAAHTVLGSRVLGWTGRRAYGLYLYHFPILSVFRHQLDLGLDEGVRVILGVVLSVAVAGASYRFIELPFLRLKRRFGSVS